MSRLTHHQIDGTMPVRDMGSFVSAPGPSDADIQGEYLCT